MDKFDELALKVADSTFVDRMNSVTSTWMTRDDELVNFARRLRKEWVKEAEQVAKIINENTLEVEFKEDFGAAYGTKLYTLEELE